LDGSFFSCNQSSLSAWPLAYFFLHSWLQDFAYRVDLTISSFLLGSILTMLIASVSISVKVIQGARAKPISSLRYE
jgi:putative ABC transport system permease protein